jgi:nucleoside-diphosphate-sugar epimerase
VRTLVTGAAGFLGRPLVAALDRRGHAVRALVRPSQRLDGLDFGSRVEVVRGELESVEAIRETCRDVDTVLHLAAATSGEFETQFAATVLPTERLFHALAGGTVRHVVLVSSFSVYGWRRVRRRLSESSSLEERIHERDGYAGAKLWQERVARAMAPDAGVVLTVVRPGLIWGGERSFEARVSVAAGPLRLVIGPRNRPPLVHVENCADCLVAVSERPEPAGGTLNVVDKQQATSWRLQREALRRSGRRALRVPVPYAVAVTGVRAVFAVARAVLGPRVKLPSAWVPSRFEARFKPVRVERDALARLGWTPPLALSACLESGRPARALAARAEGRHPAAKPAREHSS